MKFLRKKDEDGSRLASMQARIFERSANDDIASYFFIQQFMNSEETILLDNLNYFLSGLSEWEIYIHTKSAVKRSDGQIYSSDAMHWIGFFYRYASYLTGMTSKELFKRIHPKFLYQAYPLYHSLDIVKAVQRVFETLNIEQETPSERFFKLYKAGDIKF